MTCVSKPCQHGAYLCWARRTTCCCFACLRVVVGQPQIAALPQISCSDIECCERASHRQSLIKCHMRYVACCLHRNATSTEHKTVHARERTAMSRCAAVRTGTRRRRTRSNVVRRVVGSSGHHCHHAVFGRSSSVTNVVTSGIGSPRVSIV